MLYLYSLIIAFTTTFFIVIIFNEQWIVSTVIFAPCVVVYMKKTGKDYFNVAIYELAINSVYTILIYGIIAYCCEVRIK